MKTTAVLISVAVMTAGLVAGAEPYRSLEKAQTLNCVSESGRTAVNVDKVGAYFEVTTIQDGSLVLNDRVRTTLRIQESFPATYIYSGRTTRKVYFSAGQSTSNLEDRNSFSPVKGTVTYTKDGLIFNTSVTCEVIE